MTVTDNGVAGYLPADDPNYRQFQAASQFEPNPIARQFAAMLVGTCPQAIRHDPAACAEHLQGVVAAHGFTDLVNEGKRRAEPHLGDADQALDDLIAANEDLDNTVRERQALMHEIVDAKPNRASRADIRRQLSQNQQVVAQRELVGDLEHRQPGNPGWRGWVIAVIVAVIETVVTLRIFNVDFGAISFQSFLPWLALTAGLVFFNHEVAKYLGQKRRHAREIQDAAMRLNTTALHRLHHESGVSR